MTARVSWYYITVMRAGYTRVTFCLVCQPCLCSSWWCLKGLDAAGKCLPRVVVVVVVVVEMVW